MTKDNMITILTTGSRGDTQPYIALGLALKNAGQPVRIAAFENYAAFVKSFGLEFYPIRGDVAQAAASDGAASAMQADNPLKVILSFNQLKSMVFDLQQDFYAACIGAKAIIYHPGAPIGYFIAQHLNIPSIFAPPFPMTPTRAYPALIFYDRTRLGRSFNRLTHKIFEQIMWSASRAAVKQFWEAEFGRPPQDFTCPYGKQTTRPRPTIISCSKYVFPQPDDWPEHVYNTGYWFVDDQADWQPSAELLDFLQSGPPPVYIGFGSLGNPKLAAQTTQLAIDAIQLSGQRGILASGWGGMARVEHPPEDILILESAPHSWLFPQMAAVVHHGGAGTTAAGLRAGVPAIITPSSNDQFAWGRRVYELGVGAKPIPRKRLTSENLAVAICSALTGGVQAAAMQLGSKIRSENGAERAAEIIIRCLEQESVI
jgi:sterol 3beta-glucosyltransferase